MFRIGVSTEKDARRRGRRKSFAASFAAASSPEAKTASEAVGRVAPDMTPLTEAMRRMTTDPSGAQTSSQPRRQRRRASRLPREGKWVYVPPRVPHCKDRPESPLEQPVRFSLGKSENKATRRRNHSFASSRLPGHCSEDCFPTYSVYRERVLERASVETETSPPREFNEKVGAELIKEATARAESLKARGNDAMRDAEYAKAQAFYSEGLELVIDHSLQCKQLVSKLLSNRAAAFICRLDLDAALEDCAEARRIYPKNLRAYIRSASCYTARGEFNEAQSILERALEMLSASDTHFKTIKDQIKQIQRLKANYDDVTKRCATGDVDDALVSVMEELCDYAKHCEKVWRLAILLYLQSGKFSKVEKTIQMAQDLFKLTLESNAEQFCWWRWIRVEVTWWDPLQSVDSVIRDLTALLDCMRVNSMEALETIPKTEQVTIGHLENRLDLIKSAASFKDEGNRAFGRKDYDAAVDCYSQAIRLCETSGSPVPFLSVLYCNRGAAMQGLGRYLEALGDVYIALSLNPSYAKAYLRIAQMYVESRNNAAAVETLKSLQDPQQQRQQLSAADAESLRLLLQRTSRSSEESPRDVDAYKLMGLSRKCQMTDVKKVFKRLALKLHPDKVSHSVKLQLTWTQATTAIPLIQSTVQQIRDRLRDHMQHLFKQLNSANIVLSDPEQRRKLDDNLHRNDGEGSNWTTTTTTFPSARRRQPNNCHYSYSAYRN